MFSWEIAYQMKLETNVTKKPPPPPPQHLDLTYLGKKTESRPPQGPSCVVAYKSIRNRNRLELHVPSSCVLLAPILVRARPP